MRFLRNIGECLYLEGNAVFGTFWYIPSRASTILYPLHLNAKIQVYDLLPPRSPLTGATDAAADWTGADRTGYLLGFWGSGGKGYWLLL